MRRKTGHAIFSLALGKETCNMKTRLTKLSKASTWVAAGSVLAAGTIFGGGASAQEVLPAPPAPFKGQIGLSAKDSKSDFPQPVQAPKGAPNIVLVLLDDVGFGASSTFGGPDQIRRRWSGWPRTGCATHSFTRVRFRHQRGRRCSPDAITTQCIPG